MVLLVSNPSQGKGPGWRKLSPIPFSNEQELQDLLATAPELLAPEMGEDAFSQARVAVTELCLEGDRYMDIFCVDPAGEITLVECKLASSSEVKRAVVGQLLEYAALLWKKPYHYLDQLVAARKGGKSLAGLMLEQLDPVDRESWREEFVSAVARTLDKGSFRLVIAVDIMNDYLRKSIEYLNRHTFSEVQAFALELPRFEWQGSHIVAPVLYGVDTKQPPPSIPWDRARILRDVSKRIGADGAVNVERLLDLAEDEKHVRYGAGEKLGTFMCQIEGPQHLVTIFSVETSGTGYIHLADLAQQYGEEEARRLADELSSIQGFNAVSTQVKNRGLKYPSFKVSALTESDLGRFADVVRRFHVGHDPLAPGAPVASTG